MKIQNMKRLRLISLQTARHLIKEQTPHKLELVSLDKAGGRVCGQDIIACSDCPSTDSSLKDGFAVITGDVKHASPDNPVRLELIGTITAGQQPSCTLKPGQAIRIMTGAPVPKGADTVLASECARQEGKYVFAFADAQPGQNILTHGRDVSSGETIVKSGTVLNPACLGLLAAGGIAEVAVLKRPKVIIVATGSELVAPGEPINAGRIAASNLVTLSAELKNLGINAKQMIIRDDLKYLQQIIKPLAGQYDLVVTCGGMLDGDRDFTIQAMEKIGVEPVFQRIRMAPGKWTCLGKKDSTLFFNLPGGPPSNYVAFLLLVRPAVLQLSGITEEPLLFARLTEHLSGHKGWTQVYYGRLGIDLQQKEQVVAPVFNNSRLQKMAEADCLLTVPEEYTGLKKGTLLKIWKIR